ncbi:glycosyltransferase [Palleronia sp. LCG004]|uniref:glycosyltransferase n=1 Tax=Palleronia sp. LCG004 TaxID=3079304 RepID=UPI00294214DC|nr:glycosyltransferase [Palleronia sp. LCG004]WOI58362.1 glycosyltransferase [Palleronia sp. LCG004]
MSREAPPQMISVIVPVFDVEDHVADCIDALRAQTHPNFEVLVIDDGSRDESAARARTAIGDDPRFRLVSQDNRGLSGARNAGLDLSQGDLVAFVDGDDRVAPDFLWQMARALDVSGADWVACAIRFRHDDPDNPAQGSMHSAIHGAADLAAHAGPRSYPLGDWREVARHFPSAWNKLYRRTLIEGLRFPEGTWFEDHGFYWRAAARATRIAHLPQPLYIQTRGRAGQITAQDDDRVSEQFAVLDDLRGLIDDTKSHGAEAFENIASRLIFERTTALRDPDRRARYMRGARDYLAERGLAYSPDWDPDVARSFALELSDALPLSVVIPWNGSGDLDASLAALAAQHGPGREVLIVVPEPQAQTARTLAATHPEARVIVHEAPGPDAARDRGLSEARGRFVQILEAGDRPMPGALQQMADAMIAGGATLGVMPHLDAEGTLHHSVVPGPAGLPPAIPGLDELRPHLSAMIVARAALPADGPVFAAGPRGAWRVAMTAAGPEARIAMLGWAGIVVADPLRAPDAGRLVRVYDANVAGLPPSLVARLPPDWRRRVFARALWEEIARAPRPVPRLARLRFLAGVRAAILRRRLGGPGAVLDPDMPSPMAELFDGARALGDPRRALGDLFALRRKGPDDIDSMIRVPKGGAVSLRFTARVDGAKGYANLGLLDGAGRDVIFHLSLQREGARIVVNDRRGGAWARPRVLPLGPVEGPMEIGIDIAPDRIRLSRDGRGIRSFPGRVFGGLDRIAMADPQGGIEAATFRVARAEDPVPGEGLTLDPRLVLRGRVPGAAGALALEIPGLEAPHLVVRPRDGAREVRAALPGRLWQGASALRLSVVEEDGRRVLGPLAITREDVRIRVEAALSEPGLRGDVEAATLVIEHVRFAGLEPDLSPAARAALGDLARFYRLDGFLAEGPSPAPGTPPVAPPATGLVDLAVARVVQGLRADPPADAARLLAQSCLPRALLQGFFLGLSDVFTGPGHKPEALLLAARQAGLGPIEGLEAPWTASAALPFLLDRGEWDDLGRALDTLEEPGPGWIVTPPFAFLLEEALTHDDLPAAVRERIVDAFLDFGQNRADDHWGRVPCERLAAAAARLAQAQPETVGRILATYGLSTAFWDAIGDPPSGLASVRSAFDTLSDPAAAAERIEDALAIFADNPDANRWRRMRLGPAGTADPDRAGPVALLRHMACPGTVPPADPGSVAQALPALLPGMEAGPEAPLPPHDTIVVVFSCRAHLDTRIPALRTAWLDRLKARGIPHVVVVGDGDGQREDEIVHLDAPDDYEGLPQKTLAAIDWVLHQTAYSHMMKIDDDCFLNVDAVFDDPVHAVLDYHGRRLTRVQGQLDRAWHMPKSTRPRGRLELDRSPEPSIYADGGSGYTLSRRAMEAARDMAASPEGQALVAASFMEDKLVGDLLAMAGIAVSEARWPVTIRRRHGAGAIPVSAWQGGFDASALWPVKLVHLDAAEAQSAARARLSTPEIAPPRIWPSFQEPRLGHLSNALELVSDPSRIEALREAPVAVMAVMRNEIFMIERFLEHYRSLGVTAFAVADNLSDDGTLEYLAAQPDVATFSVDTDYGLSQYGTAWQEAMMAAFRPGRWTLLADADELLVWQDPQRESLAALLERPDFEDADAARIFMLDMYPRGPLSEADFRGNDPFTEAGFCEAHPFLDAAGGLGPFSDRPTWTSALRHRLIPGSRPQLFVAQKYALLRYGPQMRLSAGLHYVGGTRLAARELLFAHFKYNADFRRKAVAEVARRQHFNDAEEYRRYLALASEGRDVIFEEGFSLRWTESPFVRDRLD